MRQSSREIRWDVLKYHRNNASYRMLIEICRLTVEGLLLTTEKGSDIVWSSSVREWVREREQGIYFGGTDKLTTEHLLPRSYGGEDITDTS